MTALASRFGTIRSRITAIAALAVGLVLTLAAIALVALVRWELFNNLDQSLAQRADTLETIFLQEEDEDLAVLLNSNDEDRAAQLVGRGATVITATPNLAGLPSLDLPSNVDTDVTTSLSLPQLDDDSYRVLSREVETGSGPAVLHVVQNIDDLGETVRNLTIVLAIAVPLVVAILAALVWWLVGRTLQPVESIRSEVADISGTDLQRRVPVPNQADEIARLASTMNQMLDRIDLASRQQRQFVADASHELRTPLTRIRTELEVDARHPESADPSATNAALLQETLGLQQLLDDLLFLARSDEHQHSRAQVPLDLDDIVLSEAQSARDRSPTDRDIQIDSSTVSGAHLSGDGAQLRRVVRNLLSNAVRHASTTVSVSLVERDGVAELTVTDDGSGVPEEARKRIFDRFGRADDARTRDEGGSGLGLSIVRDIVERHNGTVHYDETWPSGARFIVEFPMEGKPT